MATQPQIVILGAGFAGLQTAVSLGGAKADVYLIDRNAYHTFVPLLYQVATATLLPEQIAFPVRSLCRRHRNLHFIQAEVQAIDTQQQHVYTNRLTLEYDFLVLATGSQSVFYGVPGASEHALPLRSLQDAIHLRNHLLRCFETARWETDPQVRAQLLTFAIVGGGATGVEMAGALVELIQGPLKRDYPELDPQQIQIHLLQSGAQLLSEFPARLGRYTARRLIKLGVEVCLETRASQVTPHCLELSDGRIIATATVIWTAGVKGQPPASTQPLDVSDKQQLQIGPALQVNGHPNIYAIGDVAEVRSRGHPLSGVAPEALQQGVATARNLRRQLSNRAPRPFHYFNKGRLAIIGCYSGVGKIGPLRLSGWLAWAMWLGVHLVYLPGYLSRIQVLLTWFNAYIWGDRTVRQRLGE